MNRSESIESRVKASFRAGDFVRYKTAKEDWILACDENNGQVICMGWPETTVDASDCELIKAATDEERKHSLIKVSQGCRGQYRGSLAKRQLEKDILGEGDFVISELLIKARQNIENSKYGLIEIVREAYLMGFEDGKKLNPNYKENA